MPDLTLSIATIKVHDVTVTESSGWFHGRYPFRVPVGIVTHKNAILDGEVISCTLPARLVTANKVRADLADIVVARYDGKFWYTAPSYAEYADAGSSINVHFQALGNTPNADVYYIYYGNSKLLSPPDVEIYQGALFHNVIDFHARYVSFTNPSQDWEVEDDHIVGQRPSSRVYLSMSVERFKLIGRRGPDAGMINIRVGDVLIDTVDLFADQEQLGVELYSHELINPGQDEIRIDLSPVKNVSSKGHVVRLDNIMYDTYATIEIGPEEINPAIDWISNVGAKE